MERNVKKSSYMKDELIYTHPAQAVVQFTRMQSSHKEQLFGSSIHHNNIIRMEVSYAEEHRNLNRDWIMDKGTIVSVEMSQSQFAEAITSFNVGCGTPVTLKWLNGEKVPLYEAEAKMEQFNREFKDSIDKVYDNSKELEKRANELLSKGTLKSAERKELKKLLDSISSNVRANLSFIGSQFNRQVDLTIKEAKGEIEAFTEHKVRSIGLDNIKQIVSITNSESDE